MYKDLIKNRESERERERERKKKGQSTLSENLLLYLTKCKSSSVILRNEKYRKYLCYYQNLYHYTIHYQSFVGIYRFKFNCWSRNSCFYKLVVVDIDPAQILIGLFGF